jgi:regulator of replication initiation timing
MSLQEKILILETSAREAVKKVTRLREERARLAEENRLLRQRLAQTEAPARPAAPAPDPEAAKRAAERLEAMALRLDGIADGPEEKA